MKRARLRLALVAAVLSGCAVIRGEPQPAPELQFEQGLAALDAGEFARARTILDGIYREHWGDRLGQRAMLVLAAAELDPRNAERRLASAADLTARYLGIEDVPAWHYPLVESLYLVALELGAAEDRIARAEQARQAANAERAAAQEALSAAEDGGRALPTSPRESVPTRIRRLTTERDELRGRVTTLEQRLAAREQELKDAQAELERIRKTLQP